eukprot:4172443-Amphidinium_carterae.1
MWSVQRRTSISLSKFEVQCPKCKSRRVWPLPKVNGDYFVEHRWSFGCFYMKIGDYGPLRHKPANLLIQPS